MDPEGLEDKAKELVAQAAQQGITLRMLGALAFRAHCPEYKRVHQQANRILTDIDFMAYYKQKGAIEKFFKGLGWAEDVGLKSIPGIKRSIFDNSQIGYHTDVFYDTLEMCHDINFAGRLEIDSPTISLVDLFLEKMQIVELNEKDVIDTIMLFLEHNIGENDRETVNVKYLRDLCSKDWGLWRTVTMNVGRVKDALPKYDWLTPEESNRVEERLSIIQDNLEKCPKTFGWKMRARVGDKMVWYRKVEEVKQ